jgi:hypothetical protein
MAGLVDSRELRRFIVRIDSADGVPLGTGFFAAPGWAITCAHVVGQRRTVKVVPADSHNDLGKTSWEVAARSELPPADWNSAFWPFPDLALLRADSDVEHLCPLLEPLDPTGDHYCHTWGYAQIEDGVSPHGSPGSFRFEGVDGSGFLQLKAGNVSPGLSGAPLVCPARRAIVGVVAVSRDRFSDAGGWATPISALTGGDGVPEPLAEHGIRILSTNSAAVGRYRREWNAVLPVDSPDVLDQPWARFIRGPRSVPSSLLRADFGVVPYLFHDAALTQAAKRCDLSNAAAPISITRVRAYGGAGKTRFAIELCKRLEPQGWVTGLWSGDPRVTRTPLPRLVVIDYAEEAQAAGLRDSLIAFVRHATALAPVHILLLTRTRTGQAADALTEIEKDAPARLRRVLDFTWDDPVADKPLTLRQRESLYIEAVSRFTDAWCPQAVRPHNADPRGTVPDLGNERYGIALDVLFEALADALALCGEGAATALTGGRGDSSPAERALTHEEKYWQITAPSTLRGSANLLRECVGLVTLAGARDRHEAESLLSIPDQLASPQAAQARRELSDWLSSMYHGPSLLNPLLPDRLGEALVSRAVRDQGYGSQLWIGRVLGLDSDSQVERCLDVLARLCGNDAVVADAAAAALSRAHKKLTARAEEQASGTSRLTGPGRSALTGALHRLLTPRFCALIRQQLTGSELRNLTYRRDLFLSFTKLADLALAARRPADSETLYRQSLQVAQELAAAEPANRTYRRDLFLAYTKLADLALAARRPANAETLYRQSLQVAAGTPDASYPRGHHGSHRHLLWAIDDEPDAGHPLDAIIVPTNRPPAHLRLAASLAASLGCPLVTLHSGPWTNARAAAERVAPGTDLIAIDVPEPRQLHLPDFRTSELLERGLFARQIDVSRKRNLALMLCQMLNWSRVAFVHDTITDLDPDDFGRAADGLSTYNAVGLEIGGFPNLSVVGHAFHDAGGDQQAWLGGGAIAVAANRDPSFFPEIYRDDWLFLVDTVKNLQPVASTGRVAQYPYDPFRGSAQARTQALGDFLAEGIYWLLDLGQPVAKADVDHWSRYLTIRLQFIERVSGMVIRQDISAAEKGRRIEALKGSMGRLARINPEFCDLYIRAWAHDREQWRRHLLDLPTNLEIEQALRRLARPGAGELIWRRRPGRLPNH